jgi:hypothetical protein
MAFIGFFALFVLVLAYIKTAADFGKDDDDAKAIGKMLKIYSPIYGVVVLLSILIPSQRQLAFIIAAPYIVENKDIQQATSNSAEIIKLGTEYLRNILKQRNSNND